MTRPGRTGRERTRAVAACLALAVVAWEAGRGAWTEARELARRPWSDHVRVFTDGPEELVRRRLEADFELWQALRARIGGPALVHVSFRDEREAYPALRRRLTKLESLLYPIVFKGWPHDPARPVKSAGQADRSELVLDLESGRDYSVFPVCEELAAGADWRLLRVGSGEGSAR